MLNSWIRLTSCLLFLFLPCLAVPVSAGVITVGVGGDYLEIQDAVDAASDGDVLLVYEGTYQPVVIEDLGISLVADVDAMVCIENGLIIKKLAAGKNMLISGIKVEYADSTEGIALKMNNNLGAVRFEKSTFLGSDFYSFFSIGQWPSRAANIFSSNDVAFIDCHIEGGAGGRGDYPYATDGADGMLAKNSTVACYHCTVVGGVGGIGRLAYEDGGDGGTCYFSYNSFLYAADCLFQGGDAGDGGDGDEWGGGGSGGDGGHGLHLTGTLCKAYLQSCIETPGSGGQGGMGGLFTSPGPPGSPGQELLIENGYAENLTGSAHGFMAPGPVKEGESFSLEFSGEPNGLAGLLVGTGLDTQFMYGLKGQLLLSPNPMPVLFFIVPLSGSGYVDISTQLPELGPGVTDITVYMQSLFADDTGSLYLGTARTFVGLDSTF